MVCNNCPPWANDTGHKTPDCITVNKPFKIKFSDCIHVCHTSVPALITIQVNNPKFIGVIANRTASYTQHYHPMIFHGLCGLFLPGVRPWLAGNGRRRRELGMKKTSSGGKYTEGCVKVVRQGKGVSQKKIRVGLFDRCAGSTRAKDSDTIAKNFFSSGVLYAWEIVTAIHVVLLTPCTLLSGYECLRHHTEYILTAALYTDMGMGEWWDDIVHVMQSWSMRRGIHWPRHAPTALPPRKNPGTHWKEGWVGIKTVLDVLEERKTSCSYRLRSRWKWN